MRIRFRGTPSTHELLVVRVRTGAFVLVRLPLRVLHTTSAAAILRTHDTAAAELQVTYTSQYGT